MVTLIGSVCLARNALSQRKRSTGHHVDKDARADVESPNSTAMSVFCSALMIWPILKPASVAVHVSGTFIEQPPFGNVSCRLRLHYYLYSANESGLGNWFLRNRVYELDVC